MPCLRLTLQIPLFLVLVGCASDPLARGDGVYAPGVAGRGAADALTVGHRLIAAGEDELALESYTRAAAQQGLNGDTLSALGSANLKLGRLRQSEDLLRRAVEADPRFAPAWNNLGVVLMENGSHAEAAEVFKRAYAADNGNSDQIRDNLRSALAQRDATMLGAPPPAPAIVLVQPTATDEIEPL